MTLPAAYPFVQVRVDTSGLQPVAQRAPGVIAIVGDTSGAGTAAPNTPFRVDTLAQAAELFATVTAGVVTETPLYRSLQVALLQNPRPSKIYGVRVDSDDYEAALASLDAADDVTFVALAGVPVEATGASAKLSALKAHCENNSAAGQRRIGVAYLDPAIGKSATHVADVVTAASGLKSDTSRMILVAARGAADGQGGAVDVASAAMAAMAGYAPHISMVLKRVVGFRMPVASQYSPAEINGLSEANIIPIIDPALVMGESLHFAEGRCFTTDANLTFIDVVRTLDDVEFRLKAGLIGLVGDARVTRSGLNAVVTTCEGILEPLERAAVIDGFAIDIPVLRILNLPETARTAGEQQTVADARANRLVDLLVSVTLGPAVHRLVVTLQPRF